MEKNYKFSVPNVTGKVRLDKYITQFVENASRTKVKKAIDLGNVLVNGDCVKCNYIVKPEDEIEILDSMMDPVLLPIWRFRM